jgi:hypothetical protein
MADDPYKKAEEEEAKAEKAAVAEAKKGDYKFRFINHSGERAHFYGAGSMQELTIDFRDWDRIGRPLVLYVSIGAGKEDD